MISRISDGEYFEYYPFMSNRPMDKPDGNTLLYLGTKIVILKFLDLLIKEDVEMLQVAVGMSQKEPGLLRKGFGKTEPQSHDDYIGICAAAHFIAPHISREIADYGLTHGWIYEDVKDQYSVNWELNGTIAHIKNCAGIPLSPLDQLITIGGLIFGSLAKRGSTSGRIMRWVSIQTLKGKGYFFIDMAILFWEWSIKRLYPKKMGDVFSIYFSPKHPFALYMNDRV